MIPVRSIFESAGSISALLCLTAALGLVSGCGQVDPKDDYAKASDFIESATGQGEVYDPTGDDETLKAKVAELLDGGLTAHEAVQITLLNNPGLQASFFDIGVARADLVQSGLLSNPSLAAVFRFPTSGSFGIAEMGLMQNLIELWHIPARERAAMRTLERVVLEIAQEASTLAGQAKAAYFGAVAAKQTTEVEAQNLAGMKQLLNLTLIRREAGDATLLEVNVARSEVVQQEIGAREARLAAYEAKQTLAVLAGLDTRPEDLQLTDPMPEPPAWTLTGEGMVEIASAHRLDIQAAEKAVEAAEEEIELQRRMLFKKVDVGVEVEGIGPDTTLVGPAIDIELPIFDQNLAQIAKAEFKHQQAQRILEGVRLSVTQDARGAHERAKASWEMSNDYREKFLPLGESNLKMAQEAYRVGETSFLAVLQAQQLVLGARRNHIVKLKDLAQALSDLETVSGQPLSEIMPAQPTEQPEQATEQPAGQPTDE